MRIHLNLDSGIAGNMLLGACVEIGLDVAELTAALKTMQLPDWKFTIARERRKGLVGTHLDVEYPHEHAHRHLSDIFPIIEGGSFPDEVKQRAKDIFLTLAKAEAVVHGTTLEEVHFHEVGAVDSIVDITGAAWALWKLGVTHITSDLPPTGAGRVKCDHGIIPIPVPAVLEIFRQNNIDMRPDPVEHELVTPTGAAILATVVNEFGPSRLTRIDHMGYGLGTRELPDRINGVRILAQNETDSEDDALSMEPVMVLSAHVDDMNPEYYGLLWERLLDAGALDAALIPMYMKKGRPGVRIEVVTAPGKEQELGRVLLRNTTSLGVRLDRMERLVWKREHQEFDTPHGKVKAVQADGLWRLEYESLLAIAREKGWGLPETQQRILPHMPWIRDAS